MVWLPAKRLPRSHKVPSRPPLRFLKAFRVKASDSAPPPDTPLESHQIAQGEGEPKQPPQPPSEGAEAAKPHETGVTTPKKPKKPTKQELRRQHYEEVERRYREEAMGQTTKPPTPTQSPTGSIDTVASTVRDLVAKRGANLVSLLDVRNRLSERGITDRSAQDKLIHEARRQGLVSSSAIEGRIRPSQEELAAAIREGNDRIGFLSMR